MPRIPWSETHWPEPLEHIPAKDFLAEEMVTVAEISEGESEGCSRDLCLALLAPQDAARLTNSRRLRYSCLPGTGMKIENRRLKIEPLAVKWEGGAQKYVQVPSARFLSAFGLVPRPVGDVVNWDDMSQPLHDVVRAEMVSVYDYPNTASAVIQVHRDYLLEYADRTNRAIIALWYELNRGPNPGRLGQTYNANDFGDFSLPGGSISLCPAGLHPNSVEAEFWGVRMVYTPDSSPVQRAGSTSLPPLTWPGLKEPVSHQTKWPLGERQFVYIRDAVLDKYEEHPETYTVHPDIGAVRYAGQWSVSRCRRVGREIIEVEVKKLYEGAPDDVIRHWHKHSVNPPSRKTAGSENVGTRSKRIVMGLIALGEALCRLSNAVGKPCDSAAAFAGVDVQHLFTKLWYDDVNIRPITRRIPLDMGRDTFLNRCQSLVKLVVEGLDEKRLRELLVDIGFPRKETCHLGSLKLLDLILQLSSIAGNAGLILPDESDAVAKRYREKLDALRTGDHLPSPISFLFKLYDLRTKGAAHRGGDTEELLRLLQVQKQAVVGGWGAVLDQVYDSVAEALEQAAEALERDVCQFRGGHSGGHSSGGRLIV